MISVIIPTYHEESVVLETINHTKRSAESEIEIIVVDSSEDGETRKAAKKGSVTVIPSDKGRANQMNAGARLAHGDILLFLHADTRLPQKWDAFVRDVILVKKKNYGAFYKSFDSSSIILKLNAWATNVRLRWFGSFLGDNAPFFSAKLFKKVKGFPKQPLMEDVELSKRLKGEAFGVISEKLITSARRFEKHGILKMLLYMQWLRIKYFFGVKAQDLKY